MSVCKDGARGSDVPLSGLGGLVEGDEAGPSHALEPETRAVASVLRIMEGVFVWRCIVFLLIVVVVINAVVVVTVGGC